MSIRVVHHLNCGTLCPIAGKLLGSGTGLGRGHMVCHCLLIETARDGLVLVDTGFGARDVADPGRVPGAARFIIGPRLDARETATAQITALGLSPADVRHIVLTHLDLDHAGGLPDFPDAMVHLHRREHDAAMARSTGAARRRYVPIQWVHGPRWETYEAEGDTWRGLPAVSRLRGLDADVGLLPMFGHTAGHSAVVVTSDDRALVHAGDAIIHGGSLVDGVIPFGLRIYELATETDKSARLASVAALRELARQPDVDIVCSHDAEMLSSAQA